MPARSSEPGIVLGLDTAGSQCGVAVLRRAPGPAASETLAARVQEMRRGHAEALVPMVLATVTAAGLRMDEIGLIGVTIGPGAFTGLRIGLAAAGGLALGLNCGIVGIDSFTAIARTACPKGTDGRPLWVLIDSRRGDAFARPFAADLTPLGAAETLDAAGLADRLGERPALLAGDGAATLGLGDSGAAACLPVTAADPRVVAQLALERSREAQPDPPEPLYLRPPDATPAPPLRPIAAA